MDRPRINVFIKEGSWVAAFAAFYMRAYGGIAIVFFRTIHLHKMSKQQLLNNELLLRHEVRHVLQYHEETYFIFLLKYFWYSLKHGYYNNPFEIDARKAELDSEILNQVIIQE